MRFARVPKRPVRLALAGGLALCLLAQALALDYAFRSLLYGVAESPGGIAGAPGHAADRNDWVDDALPGDDRAALLAPMPAPGSPYGGAEVTEYWNRSIDVIVALRFANAPVVASAGHAVADSALEGGAATWTGPDPGWLAAPADDPRAQFAGIVSRPPRAGGMVLTKLERPIRSVWTASGLEPDGYVPEKGTGTLTLARKDDGVRAVRLTLRGADGLPKAARWADHGAVAGAGPRCGDPDARGDAAGPAVREHVRRRHVAAPRVGQARRRAAARVRARAAAAPRARPAAGRAARPLEVLGDARASRRKNHRPSAGDHDDPARDQQPPARRSRPTGGAPGSTTAWRISANSAAIGLAGRPAGSSRAHVVT